MFESHLDPTKAKLLIPGELCAHYGLPPLFQGFETENGVYRLSKTDGRPGLNLEVWPYRSSIDPAFVVRLYFTHLGQIEIAWLCANDLTSKRFNIDEKGRLPLAPSSGLRNVEEEKAALLYGLAPNQIRKGLHLLRPAIHSIEEYATAVGATLLTIFPMAYHNGIEYEHCGFAYRSGQELMEEIHAGFSPGGALLAQLDGKSVFREPWMALSVRGRSWAVHSGILGNGWYSPEMWKAVGQKNFIETAKGVPW